MMIRIAICTFLVLLFSGCAAGPEWGDRGGPLPLWIRNETGGPIDATLRFESDPSRSLLVQRNEHVANAATHPVSNVELSYGSYLVNVSAGGLVREVRLQFRPENSFYRIVVQPDAIAYQTG